jgi:plasmid stabilization system protein ParE
VRFEVELAASCSQDLGEVYAWIALGSRPAADRWLEEIHSELETLAVFPKRCPLAPDAAAAGIEFRQLLCGDYRIIFHVEGQKVFVQHVRHASRLPIADGN